MALRAVSYLGGNTLPALEMLVGHIEAETGVGLRVDQVDPASSSTARATAGEVDLVWMCGALYVDMADAGALDHDVVAAPVFVGEESAVYRSVIISRPDGPATMDQALGRTVAINEPESWSGHRALRRHVSPLWFAGEIASGSHIESINAVAGGAADCAAIDHSIWDTERRNPASAASQLVVIDRTVNWPSPPLLLRRSVASQDRIAVVEALLNAGPVPGVKSLRPVTADTYAVMSRTIDEAHGKYI